MNDSIPSKPPETFKFSADKPSNYSFFGEINGKKIELIDRTEYDKVKAQVQAITEILTGTSPIPNPTSELIYFNLNGSFNNPNYQDTHGAYDPWNCTYRIVRDGDYAVKFSGLDKELKMYLKADSILQYVSSVRST